MHTILAPFSAILNRLLSLGYRPSGHVYIYMGHRAWEVGKRHAVSSPTDIMILPDDIAPERYQWPVKGCDCLILDTGSLIDTTHPMDRMECLVIALYRAGASDVIYLDMRDASKTIFYNKDV